MGLEGLVGLLIFVGAIIFFKTIKDTFGDYGDLIVLLIMGYGIYIFITRDPPGLYEDVKNLGAPSLPVIALWRYVAEMKKDLQKKLDEIKKDLHVDIDKIENRVARIESKWI